MLSILYNFILFMTRQILIALTYYIDRIPSKWWYLICTNVPSLLTPALLNIGGGPSRAQYLLCFGPAMWAGLSLHIQRVGNTLFFWGGGEGRRHNFVIDCCVTIKITVDIVTKLSWLFPVPNIILVLKNYRLVTIILCWSWGSHNVCCTSIAA